METSQPASQVGPEQQMDKRQPAGLSNIGQQESQIEKISRGQNQITENCKDGSKVFRLQYQLEEASVPDRKPPLPPRTTSLTAPVAKKQVNTVVGKQDRKNPRNCNNHAGKRYEQRISEIQNGN